MTQQQSTPELLPGNGTIILACAHCGALLRRKPSRLRGGGPQYCSFACSAAVHRTPEATARRFWSRVQKTATCWLWTGRRFPTGYGQFHGGGKHGQPAFAHRYAYELLVGPIPAGLHLDHVRARGCTNKHCVNPAHLEPVTPRENMLRGDSPAAANAAKTHCAKGHPFSPENTYRPPNGGRECRICQKAWRRERYRREQALAARAGTITMLNAAKTQCVHGHPFSPENTGLTRGGRRYCRRCTNARNRAAYWRRKERRAQLLTGE